jgi:hypothetical protein
MTLADLLGGGLFVSEQSRAASERAERAGDRGA